MKNKTILAMAAAFTIPPTLTLANVFTHSAVPTPALGSLIAIALIGFGIFHRYR